MEGSNESLPVLSASVGAGPAVLLTPGRTRNIAQDMEALRLSRHDNPYLQQVIASRESLIDSHAEESEADDTVLMSQEFGSSYSEFDLLDEDPSTLKEVHEHMIRSPPPINYWPQEGLSCRTSSAFNFSTDMLCGSHSVVTYSSVDEQSLNGRSPRRSRASRSAEPRRGGGLRPLSLPGESHIRSALRSCEMSLPRRRADAERLVPTHR